ncbi:MAG: hypothetical protein JXQ65_08545 [Candidatus Marinimicrobia bacterium]|nr:hypothetical protein [Candidatus Neomarinimicrobiota bacterium]
MISLQVQNRSFQLPQSLEIAARRNIFSSIIKTSDIPNPDYKIFQNHGSCSLFKESKKICQSNKIHDILYTLEWNLVDDLISHANTFLQIHAAALTFKKDAYLFVGDPGAGKTSLSILLSQKGFNILSDEVGLLDLNNLEVYAFPRNFIIKNHLFHLITMPENQEKFTIDSDTDEKERASFLPINYFNPENNLAEAKLKKIFFLQKLKDINFKINSLGQTGSFGRLLPQIFNIETFSQNRIINLIQTVSCFELMVSKPLLFDEEKANNLREEILR